MGMTVLMLAPGYPGEMPLFTRALAEQGATVLGCSNGPGQEQIGRAHV